LFFSGSRGAASKSFAPPIDAGAPIKFKVLDVVPMHTIYSAVTKNAKNPEGAKELLAYLITDTQAQAAWAKAQGALSPNVKVDPAGYGPVMKRALDVVSNAKAFAFNYDLATTPPAAEVGLSMFSEFMNNPADYPQQLARAQTQVSEVFKKK